MRKGIETIKNKNNILAIIIHKDYKKEGIEFFTPVDLPQQVGFISHKKGKIIEAHTHKIIKREIYLTQEVLIIRKGKIKVDFYDSNKKYCDFRVLQGGDVIAITGGGHGYEVLKDVEMVEIKQGPYLGKDDKVRFNGIETS